jgi:tripartite ATP-independent transporter DctP family solute receptor
MKKVSVFVIVLLMAMCVSVFSQSGGFKERTIRFGTTSAASSDVVKTMNFFAGKVAEATGGKIKVEVFPGSTLGDVRQMTQNAQMGALDMTLVTPAVLSDMGAKKFLVLNLPYVFNDNEHSWKVLDGNVGNEILESLASLRLVGLGYYKDGARNFFTTMPIRKIEDLKGKKIRVQPVAMDTDMALALGINPTPIAFAELYSALQTGVVVGAENPIAGYYNGKYHEVCKYLTLDEHSNPPVVIVFSDLIWRQLSSAEQGVFKESWKQAQSFNKSNVVSSESGLLEKLKSEGVEIITISDKDKWIAAMKPVYDKYAKGLEDLLAKIRAVK